jgi:carbon storage regulator
VLILSRTPGEAVMIGDDVKIVILGISGRQIRVGISAPKSINIYREEIYPRLAPPEPNGDRAAPYARSHVRGQAYRQELPGSAGSPDHETSNSSARATANPAGEH